MVPTMNGAKVWGEQIAQAKSYTCKFEWSNLAWDNCNYKNVQPPHIYNKTILTIAHTTERPQKTSS